jgi:hypothetical protein
MLITSKRLYSESTHAIVRKLLIFAGFILVVYLAFAEGRAVLEARPTDTFSERQAVADARSIFAGQHRVGIVEYCHFPNGPIYMLLVPLALGLDSQATFRLVPLIFSAVCIGVLFLGLALYCRSVIVLPLVLMASVCLLRQPGVLYWMGGLHEQSYALAICFAGMGVSLIPGRRGFGLAMLGFVAGWIGYDMLPALAFSIFTCRLLSFSRNMNSVRQALWSSTLETTWACSGVILAIGTHLIQNAFFFGSVVAAFRDLFGSAAARAGVESAATMNNQYWEWLKVHLQDPSIGHVTRVDLAIAHLRKFLSPEWTDISLAYLSFSVIGIFLAGCMLLTALRRGFSMRAVKKAATLGSLSVIGTILAAVSWIFLMPHHARFHFHFLPRHFFVPTCLLWIAVYAFFVMLLEEIFTDIAKRKKGADCSPESAGP